MKLPWAGASYAAQKVEVLRVKVGTELLSLGVDDMIQKAFEKKVLD